MAKFCEADFDGYIITLLEDFNETVTFSNQKVIRLKLDAYIMLDRALNKMCNSVSLK